MHVLLRSFFAVVMMSFLSLSVSIPPAWAGDDGQQSVFGAFIDKITGADDLLRTTPPIIYHERAPLIMPKNISGDLPPPSDTPIARTRAWPKDPDVAQSKQAKARSKMPEITADNSNKL